MSAMATRLGAVFKSPIQASIWLCALSLASCDSDGPPNAPPAAVTPAEEPAAAPAAERPRYTVGVVPQQSASRLAAQWGPLLQVVGERAGVDLVFKTASDIPTFEDRCRAGAYDVAYMNPYHYTVFHDHGYEAVAKRANSKIKGIIVKRRGAEFDELADLEGAEIAFPAPRAFAATLLTTAGLRAAGVAFSQKFVDSHDSVYMNVARGRYVAGGGILRTLNSVSEEIRDQLDVLWETPGFTPHAFAAHQRVPERVRRDLAEALVSLAGDDVGRQHLAPLKIRAIEVAVDSDWDDVRALEIQIK